MGYGRGISRFTERKRVVPDKNLGPLIATDMTRCIHCTRCVRFGTEVAGLTELGATGRGEDMRIGTFIERSVDSELSGNVIDVCPVGALTSKPFRFRARAWEMVQREGVAAHDAVGSNVHVHVRRGRLLRVVPRENEAVNEVWLSDRDRFSYEGLYAEDRLLRPRVRGEDGAWREVDWEIALDAAAREIRAVLGAEGPAGIGALASPVATTEEHYLLQALVRGLGGANLDHRLRQADFSDQDEAPAWPWLGMDLAELERVDAALVVGSNVRKEQPLAGLRLRKAALAGASVFAVNPIDHPFNFDLAGRIVVSPDRIPGELAGIARAAEAGAAGAGGEGGPAGAAGSDGAPTEAERAAAALAGAERAVVLLGSGAAAHPEAARIRALARAIARRTGARLGAFSDGPNGAGAALAGSASPPGPGGHAGRFAGPRRGRDAGREAPRVPPPRHRARARRREQRGGPRGPRGSALGGRPHRVRVARDGVVRERAPPDRPLHRDPGHLLQRGRAAPALRGGDHPARRGAPGVADPARAREPARRRRLRPRRHRGRAGGGGREHRGGRAARQPRRPGTRPRSPGAEAGAAAGEGEKGAGAAAASPLWRVGEVPLYAVDPLVRRAGALQRTVETPAPAVRVNPAVARAHGLVAGGMAAVRQNGNERTLAVEEDPTVADGCLLLHAGVAHSAGLGPAWGPVTVEPAPS